MPITAASIDRLKGQLLTSGLSQKDQPLFQIINALIEGVRQSLGGVQELSGGSGGGGSVLGQSFITKNNDQVALPNSRQILPGSGIGFNDNGEQIIISNSIPFSVALDGEDGLPGIQGPIGLQGIVGPSGGQIYLPTSEEIEAVEQSQFLGNSSLPTIFQDVPFDALNFTASGTMAWGLTAPDQLTYRWCVFNGNIMALIWDLETTSVTAPLSTDLRLKIPGGYIAAAGSIPGTHLYIDSGGTPDLGYVRINTPGQNFIQIRKRDSSNWTASVNNTTTIGTAFLEVKL